MDSNEEEIKAKTPEYYYEKKKEKKESSGSSKHKSGSKDKTSPNWAKNPIYKLSQIKKPTRRNNNSSVIWSPRRKTDSYLKRKIKNLQEAGGMNETLDQTLESANLHFTKIAREKIAAKEAAKIAVESRKYAMVQASWCRILKAARIKNKEAERELEKTKKIASEAFESARKIGVMMYDVPDSQNPNYFELQSRTGTSTGTSHKITASFETPFEVDKQVSNAVKGAFLKLANKDEFKGLLWKIRENPQENQELFSTGFCETGQTGLVNEMFERLRGLREGELVSLAEIVATCGLSEALLEVESKRLSVDEKYELGLGFREEKREKEERESLDLVRKKEEGIPSLDKFLVKRVCSLEREKEEARNKKSGTELGLGFKDIKKREKEVEIPSLDKFLVKRVSKFEREVQEARNKKSDEELGLGFRFGNSETLIKEQKEEIPSLDKILVKRVSKLEREKEEARKKSCSELGIGVKKNDETLAGTVPGLESVMKKHMSKFEKEVHEAKKNNNKNNNDNITNNLLIEKNLNLRAQLPPRITRLQKAKLETLKGFNETGQTGLDKILIKPVHWLERERNKKEISEKYATKKMSPKENVESLSDVLKSRNSKEFELKSQNLEGFEMRKNEIWERKKEQREKELMENWGNLSLENSIKPRLSRIERDKIAWKENQVQKW